MANVELTGNFLATARCLIFADSASGVWSFNPNTNTLTITAAGGSTSAANPTADVGLTAVNGNALTWMRSDAAPPIDVSIAPTWTGAHHFTPTAGIGVTVTGVTGGANFTALFQGGTASGDAGVKIKAGVTSNGDSLSIGNAANSQTNFQLSGDGHFAIGWNGSGNVLTGTTAGVLTFAGTAAGTPILTFNSQAQSGSGTITIALTDYPGTNVGAKTPKYIPIILDGSKYWIQALPD